MRISTAGTNDAGGPRARPPRVESAFTLLETIVVLAIVALAVGMVRPRLGDLGARAVDEAAHRFADATTLARERAILSGRPARVRIDLDTGRWAITAHGERPVPVVLPPAVHVRAVLVEGLAPVTAGATALALDPTGDLVSARIEFGGGGGAAASVVVPAGGRRARVLR